MKRTRTFALEQLRAPFTLALLLVVPALFVVAASGALSDFADALGGSLADDAAVALGAGWSAAFVAGTLGFFQSASSRAADRRLSLAGLGPAKVAASRLGASVLLATLAAGAGFVALWLRTDVPHPWHAAGAVLAYALVYVSVGVLVGAVVQSPLEGSLVVVFVFLLDVFAGPGMTGDAPVWAITQKAADILIAAGLGTGSSAADWLKLGLISAGALTVAVAVFSVSSRRRT